MLGHHGEAAAVKWDPAYAVSKGTEIPRDSFTGKGFSLLEYIFLRNRCMRPRRQFVNKWKHESRKANICPNQIQSPVFRVK